MIIILKKTVALALCFASVIMSFFCTSLSDFDTSEPEPETAFDTMIPSEVREAMEKQAPALEAYFNLISYFEKDEFGVPIYPENYAGEYINAENELIVQLTDRFSDHVILSYLSTVPIIRVKYVMYSYDELLSERTIADELYASGVHIVSDGVDIIENRYMIAILKEDLDDVLLKYPNSPRVLFKEGTYAQAVSNLVGGEQLYNDSSWGDTTLGICGTYGGQDAFLTCGHGSSEYQHIYSYSPQYHQIGEIVYQQANTNPDYSGFLSLGDYAIVKKTSSSDTITNDVMGGVEITGLFSSVPVGTTVFKYGYAGGYAWGNVTNVGIREAYTNNFGTVYYTDGCYEIPVRNSSGTQAIQQGDSGGPVWRSYSGENYMHGIVTAQGSSIVVNNVIFTRMYTTPIYYPVYYKNFQPKLD